MLEPFLENALSLETFSHLPPDFSPDTVAQI
jgi:hypothetical protein